MKRSYSRSPKKRSQKLRLSLKKGSLGQYGYKALSPKRSRQRSLQKAHKGLSIALGSESKARSTLIKKLNVLSIYNKNVNPALSKSVKGDMAYVRKLEN
jgi:hypothetical protein